MALRNRPLILLAHEHFLKMPSKWRLKCLTEKEAMRSLTCNIKAIIDAPVNGAKGATSNDRLDEELRRINLPTGSCSFSLLLFLFLPLPLQCQCPAQMPLQLLIQALQIYLICSHIPITVFLHLSLFLSIPTSDFWVFNQNSKGVVLRVKLHRTVSMFAII